MSPTSFNLLTGLIFLYSFFEFFLKRVVWGTGDSNAKAQGAVLFVILAIGTLGKAGFELVAALLVFVLLYIVVELAQQRFKRETRTRFQLEIFIVRQFSFVALLYVLYRVAEPASVHPWYAALEIWIVGSSHSAHYWITGHFPMIAAILATYLFMVDGGTCIVRGVLSRFPGLLQRAQESMKQVKRRKQTANSKEQGLAENREKENAGEWIGILERIITLSFVLTDSYTAIAFALTAKSIARFKELENKDFAEYYLLGTSTSVATALLAGIILKFLLTTIAG